MPTMASPFAPLYQRHDQQAQRERAEQNTAPVDGRGAIATNVRQQGQSTDQDRSHHGQIDQEDDSPLEVKDVCGDQCAAQGLRDHGRQPDGGAIEAQRTRAVSYTHLTLPTILLV